MQYLLLIYSDESRERTAEQKARIASEGEKILAAAREAGVLEAVARLEPTQNARTARLSGGAVAFTDGPFAETKEQLGGFCLLNCSTEAEAREWASRIVRTGCPASVEIRAVMQNPALAEAAPCAELATA